jgi:hypothetical protein
MNYKFHDIKAFLSTLRSTGYPSESKVEIAPYSAHRNFTERLAGRIRRNADGCAVFDPIFFALQAGTRPKARRGCGSQFSSEKVEG